MCERSRSGGPHPLSWELIQSLRCGPAAPPPCRARLVLPLWWPLLPWVADAGRDGAGVDAYVALRIAPVVPIPHVPGSVINSREVEEHTRGHKETLPAQGAGRVAPGFVVNDLVVIREEPNGDPITTVGAHIIVGDRVIGARAPPKCEAAVAVEILAVPFNQVVIEVVVAGIDHENPMALDWIGVVVVDVVKSNVHAASMMQLNSLPVV